MEENGVKKNFSCFIIKYFLVIIGLALIVGISGIQTRELHFGEHYTVDASLEETIDFFLETRDSLYNYSDEEMKKEFYPIASIDSIRKSILNGVYYDKCPFRICLPFEFNDEYKWIKILVYPDGTRKTKVVFLSGGNMDNFQYYYTYVNSSTLGFFRSFVLARRFEWTILSESNFGWRNTTPIVVRLNPLFTWTYNIFDQEGSRY